MVATRNHPKEFPDPETATASAQDSSPRKRTTRTSTANHVSPTKSASPPQTPTKTRSAVATRSTTQQAAWSHTPSNLTLLWMAISLPLVIWDTGYVVLRPYSMPGGSLSSIWYPYGMYGNVDKTYGFKAYNAREGWTATQSYVNAVETAAYLAYMYLVYKYGEQEPVQGAGAPDRSAMGQFRALSESRTVHGKVAAWATLVAYTAATVTFWKTIIYWLIEAFGGMQRRVSRLKLFTNSPQASSTSVTTHGPRFSFSGHLSSKLCYGSIKKAF